MPRTMVNRMWHRLLGRGIVENPDDMDGVPWSPGLLDWLASDFVDGRLRPEAADGDDRVVEGVSDASGTTSRRAAAWLCVPRSGSQAPDGGAVRRRDRRDHRRLECVSASCAIATAPARCRGPPPGRYTREWQTPASSLARALGRPIRDQVFSTRNTVATTLQALELVNGERLSNWLLRGARNMLGELPPPPTALFVTPINARGGRAGQQPQPRVAPAAFDVDVSGATRLWLIVQDANSTAVDKAEAVWARGELVGANGAVTPLSDAHAARRIGSPRGVRSGGPRWRDVPVSRARQDTVAARVRHLRSWVYSAAWRGRTRERLRPCTGRDDPRAVPDLSGRSPIWIAWFRQRPEHRCLQARG